MVGVCYGPNILLTSLLMGELCVSSLGMRFQFFDCSNLVNGWSYLKVKGLPLKGKWGINNLSTQFSISQGVSEIIEEKMVFASCEHSTGLRDRPAFPPHNESCCPSQNNLRIMRAPNYFNFDYTSLRPISKSLPYASAQVAYERIKCVFFCASAVREKAR